MGVQDNLIIKSTVWLLMLAVVLLLANCRQHPVKELKLFDFEFKEDLDRLNWNCHVIYGLDRRFVSQGKKSLKLEMYPPGSYPGMSTNSFEHDWSDYGKMCVDIFNPGKGQLSLTLRIDDKEDYPPYEDRVNKSFLVKSGWNEICVELNGLLTSGTKRHLNLANITRLYLFTGHPQRPLILYLDNIRLTQ